MPKSAPRGVWRINIEADEAGSVGSASFSVEDFVPQRLEVKLAADENAPMQWGQTRKVNIDARYLYGAPASALDVEGEARLRLDHNPFPAFRVIASGRRTTALKSALSISPQRRPMPTARRRWSWCSTERRAAPAFRCAPTWLSALSSRAGASCARKRAHSGARRQAICPV
ncbi:MAG: hypothetical protein R3C40_01805 [Parvularculaceae bacterium]